MFRFFISPPKLKIIRPCWGVRSCVEVADLLNPPLPLWALVRGADRRVRARIMRGGNPENPRISTTRAPVRVSGRGGGVASMISTPYPSAGGCFSKNPNFEFIVFEVRRVVMRRRADAIEARPPRFLIPRPEVAACGRWGFDPRKRVRRVLDWGRGRGVLTPTNLPHPTPDGVPEQQANGRVFACASGVPVILVFAFCL